MTQLQTNSKSESPLSARTGAPVMVIADSDFLLEDYRMEIPFGYCHCGCGKKTNIAEENHPSRGVLKGKPMKYICGHTWKNKSNPNMAGANNPSWVGGKSYCGPYPIIRKPSHPRSNRGYICEHILIAEKILGKYINLPIVVHHHSSNELVICENQSYHLFLHKRKRALQSCGHSHWLKCTICKQYDDPKNMYITPKGNHHWHNKCMAIYHRRLRHDKNRTRIL